MKLLKKWKDREDRLIECGEPVGWFETSEKECLEHTEGAGYWKKGSVLQILEDGQQVHTATAYYKKAEEVKCTSNSLTQTPKKSLLIHSR